MMRPEGIVRLKDGHERWKRREIDMINGLLIVDYSE